MTINNKTIFNQSTNFGDRKICNVGLPILRRSFSHALAPLLQNVSVIEENPAKPKSHKSKKVSSKSEHHDSEGGN